MARRRRRGSDSGSLPPPRLLLVEGSDDKKVIETLTKAGGLDLDFEIREQQGFSGVINVVRTIWQSYGLQAIGIIVDADENLTSQWGILSESLRTHPVMRELPDESEAGGTVFPGIPRLGIWVMPDNSNSGELEDFIYRMIPQPDKIWPRSEKYIDDIIDDIPEVDRPFPEHKSLKAKVHAWMATRSRPRPMWSGISESDLVLEENSTAFLNWLRRLFGDDLA